MFSRCLIIIFIFRFQAEVEYMLTVLDLQDSPPVFENVPITIVLDENTGNVSFLNITLTMFEKESSFIVYRYVSPNEAASFKLYTITKFNLQI